MVPSLTFFGPNRDAGVSMWVGLRAGRLRWLRFYSGRDNTGLYLSWHQTGHVAARGEFSLGAKWRFHDSNGELLCVATMTRSDAPVFKNYECYADGRSVSLEELKQLRPVQRIDTYDDPRTDYPPVL
jgi:hypothetical protein